MKTVAILVVRNEAAYIDQTIRYLIDNGISIVVIDNASTDDTLNICQRYYPNHITHIKHLPFDGTFNLQLHIQEVKKLLPSIDADWIISHAADERMQSPLDGETLHGAIARVDQLGFDVINLDEFVFVHENNEADYRKTNFHSAMKYYYFFEPSKFRLMRIFRKGTPLEGALAGVHGLESHGIKLFPTNFTLRHYPTLGYQHAKEKYLTRTYNASDLKLGWHGNRINMTSDNMVAPHVSLLNRSESSTPLLDKSKPYKKHFWEWSDNGILPNPDLSSQPE